MRFIDHHNGFCRTERVKRPVKAFRSIIVIITPEQPCIPSIALRITGNQLHIDKQDIYFFSVLTASFDKIAYDAWKIPASSLFVFRRFEDAQLYFRAVAATVGKVAARIIILHELRCAGFDGKGRNGDDKLIETVAFMQFVNGLGVHIGLAGSRFHLDIEIKAGTDRCIVPVLGGNRGLQRMQIDSQLSVGQTYLRILIVLYRRSNSHAIERVTHSVNGYLLVQQVFLED